LGQAWGSKGEVVGGGGTEVATAEQAYCMKLCNQSIGGLCRDLSDSIKTRLVEHVRGRVIGEVDQLMQGTESSTKGIAILSLGPKFNWRACGQICQSLVEAWEGGHL